ncbi:MAG: hypothetical protein RJA76_39 [Bacteroidota bacterium]|jgi:type I restriction enzyme S subunit
MSEWKDFNLGSIAEITSSKRIFYSEYVEKGVPFYRSKEIIDLFNRRKIHTELYISQERYNQIKEKFGVPKSGDILLTSVGSLGIPYLVKDEDNFYFKDGNLTWFRNLNVQFVNPNFLFNWINSPIGRKKLDEISIGSTQSALTISGLKSIEISLPDIQTQKKISQLLSSLDDKIDLLNRQNRTLEQMAETLFRQWFIEDAKEEWTYVSLEDFVSIYNGVSYKSSDLNESKTAMITLKSFARNGGFRLDGFKEYSGKYKDHHIVREGDLVVAHTDITQDAALIGNPILVIGKPEYDTLVISMDLVKIETNYNWLSTEFLYFLMRTRTFKEHCVGYSNGSTVLHLSKDAVPSFEFLLPPEKLISEFTSMVRPMIKKINQNISHSRNLEQQRDTLLPKLMSGEVRIKMD